MMERGKMDEEFFKTKEYVKKIDAYRALNRKKAEIELEMNNIKESVGLLLHEDKMNEIFVNLHDGEQWKAAYQTTSRQSTDYKALMEMVGPANYSKVVSDKESTFLVIRKSEKKSKKSSVLTEKSIKDDEIKPFVPDGMILS